MFLKNEKVQQKIKKKGTSGIKQMSTCPLAKEACMAMKPLLRPISFTMPMP